MRNSLILMLTLLGTCGATTLYNNVACGQFTYEGSCSFTQAATQGGNTALDWVQITGQADDYNVDTDGLPEEAGLIVSGNGSGTLATATTIPVSWDFTVTGGAGCPVPTEPTNCDDITWALSVNITTSGGAVNLTKTGSLGDVADNTLVEGNSMMTIPAGTFTGEPQWDVVLTVGGVFADTPIEVTVPTGTTIDLNPVQSTVPEPGTVALLSLGIGALVFRKFRKARS